MNLGKKIYDLRKKAGLSQDQLAEKLDVTRQTISNWECGQTTPDIIQAINITKIFHISLDEFVDNDIKDIIVEKISNTEKQTNNIKKILKVLAIFIICCLILFIISLMLFINMNYKNNNTSESFTPQIENIRLICELNKHKIAYKIVYLKENNEIFNTTVVSISNNNEYSNNYKNALDLDTFNKESISIDKMNEFKDVEELVSYIKNFYEEQGGTCEEIEQGTISKYIN